MDRWISPPLAPAAEDLGHGLAEINTLADLLQRTVHVDTAKDDPPHRVSGPGAPDRLAETGAAPYCDADA